jgi:hypothetical protein
MANTTFEPLSSEVANGSLMLLAASDGLQVDMHNTFAAFAPLQPAKAKEGAQVTVLASTL